MTKITEIAHTPWFFFKLIFKQVLLEIGEVFPAVQSAEKAVSLDLTWSVARQTLGRAQLGIGELDMVT